MAETIEFVFKGDAASLNAALSQITREAGKAADAGEDVGKKGGEGVKKLAQESLSAKDALKKLGAGIAFIGASVAGTVVKTLALADSLNQSAKRARELGASVTEFDKVEGAIGLVTKGGVDAAGALLEFDRKIAEARAGVGEAAASFKSLGLDLDALSDASPMERLAMVADRLAGRSDVARHSMVLFGDAGKSLAATMRDGSGPLREAAELIGQHGTISAESAAEAEALTDSVDLMSRAWDSMGRESLTPLMPIVRAATDHIGALLNRIREGQDSRIVEQMQTALFELARPMAGLAGIAVKVVDAFKLNIKVMSAFVNEAVLAGQVLAAVVARDFSMARDFASQFGDSFVELKDDFLDFGAASGQVAQEVQSFFEALGSAEMVGPSQGGGEGGSRTENAAAEAEELARIAAERAEAEAEAERAKNEALRESREEAHLEYLAQIQAEQQARQQQQQSTIASASNVAGSLIGFAGDVASAVAAGSKKESESRRQAMQAAWAAQTAAAIAQAALNIPLSISQASAGPWPAAIGFMVAAGIASGAALAGVIAKAAAGPKFHRGGMVSRQAPDEINATLRRGEGVLTPAAVDQLGGPQAVHSLNRGEGVGGGRGPMVVVAQFGNRVVDVQSRAALERPNSPLSSALRASQPKRLGRHNPFGGQ